MGHKVHGENQYFIKEKEVLGQAPQKKIIDYRFRIFYAVGIILVVAGHSGNGGVNILFDWFTPYAFHLGIFAFGSGYFYKESESQQQLSYLWKKIKHLLIPYYMCNIFYGVFVYISKNFGMEIGGGLTIDNLFLTAPLFSGHQFMYNLGTWFVIPLFVLIIFNNIIFRGIGFIKNKTIFVFILYIGLGLLSVSLAKHGYNQGWCLLLTRTMFLMPMFGLGLMYRKYHFFDSIPNVFYFLLVFLFQYMVIIKVGGPFGNDIAWMSGFHGAAVLPFIVEFIGILFWLRVCTVVTPVLKDSKIINAIGGNTWAIMTHHLLAIFCLKGFFALLALKFSMNFNYAEFTHNIWYYYLPLGKSQGFIFYTLIGIVGPLLYLYLKKISINFINLKFISLKNKIYI